MNPVRLHRPAVRGWRTPEGALYVGPSSRWATPWRWRTRTALARVPALDGSAWELETRISSADRSHPYHHADGRITHHEIRYMTRQETVDLYRQALVAPTANVSLRSWCSPRLTLADARTELAGLDLVCRCAIGQPCHADVLLELANQPAEETTR
ncbi:DUF4326 domain-containing protein [Kitasatospora sp. NPDC057692]|uniref:DUF4326 domain-containing protein n=1 Tax=Kitasatospora sp. NPDC057692 TaxID=3346215 RepID=UPI0036C24D5F